jgi:predicted nucleotidyltransferase
MSDKFGLREKDLATIIDFLGTQSVVESASIFGSRAKGNYKNGSDVDIALKGSSLTLDAINQISYWLNEESLMPYKFDILNYHTLTSTELKEHIDRIGVVFYNTIK